MRAAAITLKEIIDLRSSVSLNIKEKGSRYVDIIVNSAETGRQIAIKKVPSALGKQIAEFVSLSEEQRIKMAKKMLSVNKMEPRRTTAADLSLFPEDVRERVTEHIGNKTVHFMLLGPYQALIALDDRLLIVEDRIADAKSEYITITGFTYDNILSIEVHKRIFYSVIKVKSRAAILTHIPIFRKDSQGNRLTEHRLNGNIDNKSKEPTSRVFFWNTQWKEFRPYIELLEKLVRTKGAQGVVKKPTSLLDEHPVAWGLIGFMALGTPLYYLGRIDYGWFIRCVIIGSVLGGILLFRAVKCFAVRRKPAAIALLIMTYSIASSLAMAWGELPKLPVSAVHDDQRSSILSKISGVPSFSILSEKETDNPVKTQVVIEALVSGKTTKDGLKRLLFGLYNYAMAKKGFYYHNPPTNVYIYIYSSRERAATGYAWIAMLGKNHDDLKPSVTIDETRLSLYNNPFPSEKRFGLTEQERYTIFVEIVKAEDRAEAEARAIYPDISPLSPDYSPEVFRQQLDR